MNRIKFRRGNPLRLFLLAVIFPVCLFVAACSDPEQSKAEHLQRGEAFLKEKKFAEAELEFRNALQIDSNLGAAYYGLAQASEGLQRPDTFELLRQTIAKDPNNLDARVKLANYYLFAIRSPGANKEELLAEVERYAREVLERDPNHIEGLILKSNLLFVRGDRAEALATINRAIEINPQRVETHLSLARFYTAAGELAKADEVYKRAIAMNERLPLAHLEYGRFLATQNKLAEAEAEFRRAIEADPQEREARQVLASFYLATKRPDRAEAEFRQLAELDPGRPEGSATLADFYSVIGREADAVRVYENIVSKFPDYQPARYRLGEIALQRGDIPAATKQIDDILGKNGRDTQALLLRARINLQRDQPSEAIKDLQEVLNIEPNSRAGLYYMADATMRSGQIEQAREFTAALTRSYPDYLPARLLQVQVNLNTGDSQGALRLANELIETLRKSTPDAQTTPQLLTELRAKAFTARGAAQLQLGNVSAARADMQAAAETAPNSPSSYTNLARIAVAEKRLDEAVNLYDRALRLDPTNFDALNGAVRASLAANRPDEAHRRVDAALGVNNRSAPAHYLKGFVYGAQGNAAGAETEFRRAIEIDAGYMPAYFDLASLYRNTRQEDRAIEEYRKAMERRPDDPAAPTLLGMMEDARGDRAAAAIAYRRAIEAAPNSAGTTFAANNLAWLAAEHNEGNLDEALQYAQQVVQRFPNEPGYIDTLGWVLHKKGLHAPAVEQLRKTVDLSAKRGTDSALYRFHLASALAAAGDRAGARRELEQTVRLASNPNQNFTKLDEARRMLAEM